MQPPPDESLAAVLACVRRGLAARLHSTAAPLTNLSAGLLQAPDFLSAESLHYFRDVVQDMTADVKVLSARHYYEGAWGGWGQVGGSAIASILALFMR